MLPRVMKVKIFILDFALDDKVVDSPIRYRLYEPRHEKTCLRVCDQVGNKPACTATEAS